jgi:acetyltransferase-like isoleucine patch superfamily enzyme
MGRIKSTYWRLREETKLLLLWFIGAFPAGPGAWLRARCLPFFLERLGRNTLIQQGFRVTSPQTIAIGSNCNFGQGVFITGGGGVRIGDWVGLGPDVKIWSVNHRFSDSDRPWLEQGSDYFEVVIEDDVWLAANVFVMPGTTIGRGAIVAAGSVVNKSIPAYALFAGNPGRVVGWRKRPDHAEGATKGAQSAQDAERL